MFMNHICAIDYNEHDCFCNYFETLVNPSEKYFDQIAKK